MLKDGKRFWSPSFSFGKEMIELSSFRIILRLRVPQPVVFAVGISNKRSVSSLLNDCALVEHGDLVAELTRGQTVGGVDSTLSIYVTEKS